MNSHSGLGAAIAVVVVYKRRWCEVHAAEWLESALTGGPGPDGGMSPRLGRLLVYDNSPEPMGRPASMHNCDYVHDATNGGTRAAYARALELAQGAGLSWVILLDHDTTLSAEYCSELDRILARPLDRSVGLLFPRVVGAAGVISPAVINRWGTIIPFDKPAQTLGPDETWTAVASGSTIRIEALAAVGEMPATLWLDYVDHWLFRSVQKLGYRVEFLSATLRHELSIRSETPPDSERLRNIMRAERSFTRTLGLGARAAFPIRILARGIRMLPRDAQAAWLILRQIFAR